MEFGTALSNLGKEDEGTAKKADDDLVPFHAAGIRHNQLYNGLERWRRSSVGICIAGHKITIFAFFTKFSAEYDRNVFTNFPIYILSEVDFTLDLEDAVVVQNLFLLSKSSDISKD